MLLGDTYGLHRDNPKHRSYKEPRKDNRPFPGNRFGCSKKGYRRSDFPESSKQKPDFKRDGQKVLKAINAVETLADAADVVSDLHIQCGEDWDQLLEAENSESQSESGEEFGFADDESTSDEEEMGSQRRLSQIALMKIFYCAQTSTFSVKPMTRDTWQKQFLENAGGKI